jgi:photosystem II stability/assembly factor-like uncharacterized protein
MKRIFGLAAIALCFMLAAANAQSDFQKGQAKTTASTLKVRNIASQGGTEIASLGRGELVDVIDRSPATSQIDELTDYWYKIQFNDAKKKKQTGWVFGGYITFELNMESGLRWKTVSPSGGQSLKAIAVSDNGDVFVGGDKGALFVSTDRGKTWRKVMPQALGIGIGSIKRIRVINKVIYIAATDGSAGGVWKSANNGASWSQSTTSQGLVSNEVYDVANAPTGEVYASTKKGICVTKDNGASWKLFDEDMDGEILSMAVAQNGQIFVGTKEGLQTFTEVKGMFGAKKKWVRLGEKANNMGNVVFCVRVTADGEIWVGTDKGLAKSTVADTAKWYAIGGNTYVNDIFAEGTQRITVATGNGLNISLDKGASWATYKRENGLSSNNIMSIALSPKDKVLWVISGNEAISYHD